MDLSKVKNVYPQFLGMLRERGYSKSTVNCCQWTIKRFLDEAQAHEIFSWEDCHANLAKKLSPSSRAQAKSYLYIFRYYVENGRHPKDLSSKVKYLPINSYRLLNPYYKQLVDNCRTVSVKSGRMKESSIKTICKAASAFCLYYQQRGHETFASACSQKVVIEYFHDGKKALRDNTIRYCVSAFLTANSEDSHCAKMLLFLPHVPKIKKNYDYLKPDELKKIEATMMGSTLTLRDKAIGILAYYTGLRESDIVNLKIDDIDLNRDMIIIHSQQKTGEPLRLPLRPIVRDAICEYVKYERPSSLDEHVFLRMLAPYIGMKATSLSNVAINIIDAAGIRKDGGNRGMHLFRHAMISDLISKDVPGETVSALAGHTSFDSLNNYIDADIEHLRSCALSIERFKDLNINHAKMAEYKSGGAELLCDISKRLGGIARLEPSIHFTLCSLDNFCFSRYPNRSLTQEMLDEWSCPMADESRKAYTMRMQYVERINDVLSTYNLKMEKKSSPELKKRNSFSKTFVSKCHRLFDDYVAYQIASQHWCGTYERNLRSFDEFCKDNGEGDVPTQNIINRWSMMRDTERLTSCGKRVAFLRGLCNYANTFYGTCLKSPEVPTRDGSRPAPHVFSDIELKNLFIASDNIFKNSNSRLPLITQITIPAMLRLMYSAGMRTKEVRMLDCEDVDLVNGVIDIKKSKGHHEHRVALHQSMQDYLVEYDRNMNSLMPGRKCFFPSATDSYHECSWLERLFCILWYRFNSSHAVPYDLRHHYAIANINSWPADSASFNKRLVYLSRSMGHATIENTMYYYSYTPAMARSIITEKGETYRNIIKETFNCDGYED